MTEVERLESEIAELEAQRETNDAKRVHLQNIPSNQRLKLPKYRAELREVNKTLRDIAARIHATRIALRDAVHEATQ